MSECGLDLLVKDRPTEFPIQFNAPDIAETEITKNGCRCRRIRMSAVIKRDP